jgi:hypothetical protein
MIRMKTKKLTTINEINYYVIRKYVPTHIYDSMMQEFELCGFISVCELLTQSPEPEEKR